MVRRQAHLRKKTNTASKGRLDELSFTVREFAHYPKSQLWYVGIGVMIAAFLLAALFYRDYLMVALVVAVAIALFRLSNLAPNSRQIRLTERGIYWGEQFLAYHQLKSFWIADQGGQTTVYLERPNFASTIHFFVPEDKLGPVSRQLEAGLPYHDHRGEPLSDRLARLLRL